MNPMKYLLVLFLITPFLIAAQPITINGNGIEASSAIAIDQQKNQYWTGTFGDDINIDGQTLSIVGQEDIFLTKLDSNNTVQWINRLGGLDEDKVNDIALNSQQAPCLVGLFWDDAVFDTITLQALIHPNALFITQYSVNGSVIWAKPIRGTGSKLMTSIFIDDLDQIYTTGYFTDTLFIDSDTLVSVGTEDLFIIKMDSQGNVLWTNQAGYQQQTRPSNIVINSVGEIWIGGSMNGRVIFGSDTLWAESLDWDIFLAKYNATGSVQMSKRFGGTFDNFLNDIAIQNDELYLTGSFVGLIDFDGQQFQTNQFDADIFIANLNANGLVNWAMPLGDVENEFGLTIAVEDNRIVTGGYYETNTIIGGQSFTTTTNDQNGLLVELNTNGQVIDASEWSGNQSSFVTDLAVFDKTFAVTGDFVGDIVIDGLTYNSNGFTDIILLNFNDLNTSTTPLLKDNYPIPIYPNPATDFISIKLLNTLGFQQVSIVNALGQVIQQSNLVHSMTQLDVSFLSKGIYFLHIKNNDGEVVRSFIKH